jgi:hypothetical protein
MGKRFACGAILSASGGNVLLCLNCLYSPPTGKPSRVRPREKTVVFVYRRLYLSPKQTISVTYFPRTVPDLKEQLAYDKRADPPDKYKVLEDVQDWATNIGYPGFVNAGISDVFGSWIIPNMFRQAASGKMSPEEALNAATKKVQAIFSKWRAQGAL